MTMKRRMFLKGSLAAGTVGVAVGAGLLTPSSVLAAWPKAAMEARTVDDALKGIGMSGATESGDVKIKAPDIAENGAVVPVTVSTSLSDVTNIALVVEKNGTPLTSLRSIVRRILAWVKVHMVTSLPVSRWARPAT